MVGVDTPTSREYIDRDRCAKINGLGEGDDLMVVIWTLVDPECSTWQPKYEIWGNDSYNKAGLKQDNVPTIVLIDPNNYDV
uniref:Uncharacterized protein n=1 Tax=Leersia perrieri TaxID=77586 RepID=A0A0D9UYZ6_9ORYZ